MTWQDTALTLAGAIGSTVAILHGVLIQRLMVKPLTDLLAGARVSATIRRLVAPLLHFSTAVWLVGGLALIAAASGLHPHARLATALLVGTTYLYGAIGNLWATRGRHPGWILMAAALGLIAFGAMPGS